MLFSKNKIYKYVFDCLGIEPQLNQGNIVEV